MACFEARGYDETTVGQISRGAGVAHGTFYVHFASKDEVLDELLVDFNAAMAERVGRSLAGVTAPREAVDAAAGAFLGFFAERRAFVACYAARAAQGLAVDAWRDGINMPMSHLLTGALAVVAPNASPERIKLITHALLAMWLRVGLQALFSDDVSAEQAQETLTAMTVGALSSALNLGGPHV